MRPSAPVVVKGSRKVEGSSNIAIITQDLLELKESFARVSLEAHGSILDRLCLLTPRSFSTTQLRELVRWTPSRTSSYDLNVESPAHLSEALQYVVERLISKGEWDFAYDEAQDMHKEAVKYLTQHGLAHGSDRDHGSCIRSLTERGRAVLSVAVDLTSPTKVFSPRGDIALQDKSVYELHSALMNDGWRCQIPAPRQYCAPVQARQVEHILDKAFAVQVL